ncbi:glycoside hydrolase family 97 protein [Chitinophaga filiformis]|uniref:Alpha-glucosidase n=1 Tax=Chitinophaga filiformis TaxID=104663 RepID=A0A1G8A8Q5_CHIFI|nr:glycoside hydrolase family 97 protein [Chitinophaga filiformis]SDH17253.1 alpha-glucosidase [Chitinophaga filiformis]
MKIRVLLCTLLLAAKTFAADTTLVTSPDGQVRFRLFSDHQQLYYTVAFRNTPVIDASPMILSIDDRLLTSDVTKGAVKRYTVNERYPWNGVHAVAVNNCQGATIALKQGTTSYTLDVRVFNTGIAFRTVVPGAASVNRIPDEATVFNIPAGSEVWYHDLNMHYESVYAKKEISALQAGEWVAPPATFKLQQGIYAAITEADLVNYAGMALEANGKQGLVVRLAQHQPVSYPYKLRYSEEDVQRSLKPAAISGTITTPWRVVMVGADLNTMVNNDIVQNLCPPPDPKLFPKGIHTDWIKPGRAAWKYLDGGGDGTPEVMKQFSAEAGALGFEHNILEGFWAKWTDDQIRDVVNDAKSHHVGIWVWKHSKTLRDKTERQAFFKRCHDLGITGVKIDFFDSEAKEVIDLYTAILQETARYHLLTDFHGANKPTGSSRTWPNELTREAVKGMEASKLTDRAEHETTLPFTRFLAGPAEYTVVHFGERRKNTSWAHQVASAAILSAPLLTYAARPQHILDNPAGNLIKLIPSTWDETIVLPPSEIGQLAVFARRKGDTWFLAVMNGDAPQQINIPLSFLQQANYKVSVVRDIPDSAGAVKVEEAAYTKKDVIPLQLAPGGGYVAVFVTSGGNGNAYSSHNTAVKRKD